MKYVLDFDCVILHTPMNGRASVRQGGGEGWGLVRDSQELRLLKVSVLVEEEMMIQRLTLIHFESI